MVKNEYAKLFKVWIVFALELCVVMGGLSRVALFTTVGDANFQISMIFVIAQSLVFAFFYWRWYCNVNLQAMEMNNIEDKRKKAFACIPRYALPAIGISVVIALAAMLLMLLQVIFVGIDRVYCLSAAFTECVVGSFTLLIMMRFLGLPDRVTGRY